MKLGVIITVSGFILLLITARYPLEGGAGIFTIVLSMGLILGGLVYIYKSHEKIT